MFGVDVPHDYRFPLPSSSQETSNRGHPFAQFLIGATVHPAGVPFPLLTTSSHSPIRGSDTAHAIARTNPTSIYQKAVSAVAPRLASAIPITVFSLLVAGHCVLYIGPDSCRRGVSLAKPRSSTLFDPVFRLSWGPMPSSSDSS